MKIFLQRKFLDLWYWGLNATIYLLSSPRVQFGLTFTVNEFSDIINLSDTASLLSVPASPPAKLPPLSVCVEWVCEILLGLNLDLSSMSAGSGS